MPNVVDTGGALNVNGYRLSASQLSPCCNPSMATPRPEISAAMRRDVLIEAGHRCAIQTCRNAADVDLHHIVPWEKCRQHAPENLIALCPNCHRLAHGGKIDRKALLKYKEICQKLANPPVPHEASVVHAFLKFDPNTVTGILDSKNVTSFTDNGTLDFVVNFDKPFEDMTYVINAIGDGSVVFRVMSKTTGSVALVFEEPCPNIVRLEFRY